MMLRFELKSEEVGEVSAETAVKGMRLHPNVDSMTGTVLERPRQLAELWKKMSEAVSLEFEVEFVKFVMG